MATINLKMSHKATNELIGVLISESYTKLRDIEDLLHKGADPNAVSVSHGVSAMHLAAGKDSLIMKLMLQFGGNPNVLTTDSLTPLHIASSWGNTKTTELLLQHGADFNFQDMDGKTAYDLAVEENQEECVKLLKRKITMSALNENTKIKKDLDKLNESFNNESNPLDTVSRNQSSITKQVYEYLSEEVTFDVTSSMLESSIFNETMPREFNAFQPYSMQTSSCNSNRNDMLSSSPSNQNLNNNATNCIDHRLLLPTEPCASPHFKVADFIVSSESFMRKCSISNDNIEKQSSSSSENSLSAYTTCCEELCDSDEDPNDNKGTRKRDKYRHIHELNRIQCNSNGKLNTLNGSKDLSGKYNEYTKSHEQTYGNTCLSMPTKLDDTLDSICSCVSFKEYLHHDSETDITLIEKHMVSDCSDDELAQITEKQNVKQEKKTLRPSLDTLIPEHLQSLTCQEIAQRFKSHGETCGPVIQSTKYIYLRKLAMLESNEVSTKEHSDYPPEMMKALMGTLDLTGINDLELELIDSFSIVQYNTQWREGTEKSSFTYILLDSRITQNLPLRAKFLSSLEIFQTFLFAIFYIGKGKATRPYSHLYEAYSHMKNKSSKKSAKVEKITDIWQAGNGVVSVHCFHSVIPVEAYTHEACMIEAIGLQKLTNVKKGDFYGMATKWTMQQKRKMGVYLLQKALQIFLADGERQICIPDLKKKS